VEIESNEKRQQKDHERESSGHRKTPGEILHFVQDDKGRTKIFYHGSVILSGAKNLSYPYPFSR
jgi:hypothetical protein